ncbi:myricetin 3-O-methyltransferase 3-like [Nicotiana tomentosiformis]|uniref:myricetin 3-O-methyltransferase 3-like n=1 Tax=Nicotiana tomentosiformis TaxID=4098 RepID=UPI00051C818F|nr:caffeic acid 3-O-methyltransferase-like isoform X1 [Nicotiana tomentosiformis]
MDISKDQNKNIMSNEEEDLLSVMQLPIGLALNMVLKVTMELGIFDLLSKAGPNAQLSSSQIASQIPTKNPQAPLMIEKILSFLASQSLLSFTLYKDENGVKQSLLYSLTSLSRNLVTNEDGVSLAPTFLLLNDQAMVTSWFHLKDAILEGEIPFNKAHGMDVFEYHGKDSRYAGVTNRSTQSINRKTINKILESYNGFQEVQQLVDVGGALGLTIASIVSKYPHIKGVNFDLPHVIKIAPTYPGVEHVSGDMFQSVPQGDAIFMKHVLHDWDDDDCINILKNCWKSLPNSGKLVLVEHIKPEYPKTDLISKNALFLDVLMMIVTPGGKERTKEEFETLAKKAGFAGFKVISSAFFIWIMELYK